jgi:hypothetical protein
MIFIADNIVLGMLIGIALGVSFRYLMKYCQKHDLIDRQSYVAQYVSLALLTVGLTTILGSDDLLAAFACGSAFAWDGFFNRQTEESVFSSVIDLLFNIGTFIYVGAWMPFDSFHKAKLTLTVGRLVTIAILVLLLRRLPIIIALYRWIPDIKTLREAVFSGHFGPIGIGQSSINLHRINFSNASFSGAIFISTLASERLHHYAHDAQAKLLAEAIQPIVAFMVLCSIVIHGLSIPFFSLGRHASRTLSRHASFPDWTNQTRLVDRGASIVINRDPDIEKGIMVQTEKGAVVNTTESQGRQVTDAAAGDSSSPVGPRFATPPDGDERLQQWQEGRHLVIERKTGSGEVSFVHDTLPAASTQSCLIDTSCRWRLRLFLRCPTKTTHHRLVQARTAVFLLTLTRLNSVGTVPVTKLKKPRPETSMSRQKAHQPCPLERCR